jgi:hypothetical protein
MKLFHNDRAEASTVLTLFFLLGQGLVRGQDRKPSRTSQYDASNLKCQIGIKQNEETTLSYQDFDYYYAMGTSGDIDAMKMFNLEQLLYNQVEDDMVWCWEELNDSVIAASTGHGVRRDLNRRLLHEKKRRANTDSRMLNIITFTPGSMDRETMRKFLSVRI